MQRHPEAPSAEEDGAADVLHSSRKRLLLKRTRELSNPLLIVLCTG